MPKIEKSTTKLENGVTLSYIKDEKYKTNYTNIYFSLPLDKHSATSASLVAKILKRGSVKFPSMAEINSALDLNYATTLTLSSGKEGEKEVFLVSVSTMKNAYAINGEDVFKTGIEIAFDVFTNPLTKEGAFIEEFFESEKKNLRDSILSQINNKASYSRTRFIKNMCDGEKYAVNGEGDLEVLDSLTPASLLTFFKDMIKTAQCHVYFVGDEDEDKVKNVINSAFQSIKRTPVLLPEEKTSVTPKEVKDVTEKLDINQGHLWIGYRADVNYSDEDYLKYVMFNMILGGDVSSKMFMNIREKMSLCYTCYSMLDATKGIFAAYAGIAPENKEKTLDAFFKEVEKVKSGEITEEEMWDAKKAYVNRMYEICDNPSLLAPWFHIRENSPMRDPLKDAEKIKEVTLQDVIDVANKIKLDTIYFLTSKN
ncbi:MAG: insulinase family protein [Ruminococcaceae bacterium]|nr:insulinase family protein [Oscillospiraceae bacterium]